MPLVKEKYIPLFFIVPALAYEAYFSFYPTFSAVYGSFLTASGKFSTVNYKELVGLGVYHAITNTVVVTIGALALQFLLGFAIASILIRSFRGRNTFSALLMIPFATATVVAAYIFSNVFSPVGGYANSLLSFFGMASVNWNGAGSSFIINVLQLVVSDSWKNTPIVALILLAGMTAIPKDLYDAAAVDGAGWFSRLIHITIPNLIGFIVIALVIRGVSEFNIFAIALLIFPHKLLTTLVYGLFSLAAKPYLSFAGASVLLAFILVFVAIVLVLRKVFAAKEAY